MARITKAEKEALERREAARSLEAETLRSIGKRISQARREGGLTQRQVGDHLNITETSVSNIERGVFSPYKYLTSLEKLLNKEREWFIHGEDGHTSPDEISVILDRLVKQTEAIASKLDHLASLMEPKKRGRKAS